MTITIKRLPGYGDPIVLDLETLVGADLRGANLTGADLAQSVLTRANLFGTNLRRANLSRATLYEANLTGADLTQTNLYGAYLYGAVLYGAYLTGANLRGAVLTRANLRGAKIYDDTIASLLTRAGRSDGHEFFGFRLEDGSTKIMAGCRWLTPDEYRVHVAAEYPDMDKAKETLDIIDFIERRAA